MAVERRTNCPRCFASIRLTRDELANKRGFCALCDARFDLLPEMLVGDGPLRSLTMIQAADLAQPPTSRMAELVAAGQPPRYVIRQAARRRGYPLPIAALTLWLFVVIGAHKS